MRMGRESFYAVLDSAATEALPYLHAMLTVTSQTAEAAEGIAAFTEKRPPSWQTAADHTGTHENRGATDGEASTDHRHHRSGRLLPGRVPARQGYEVCGMVRRSSTLNFERIAHIQDRITLVAGDLLDEVSMINILRDNHPTEVYNLAAQSFVQTSWSQPVLTGETTALGCDPGARRHPDRGPRDPLLPGQLVGDVRQGPRGPPEGVDALLSAEPLRGGQGLRALDHRQLPRELRPPRLVGHPVQPRVAPPRAWSS